MPPASASVGSTPGVVSSSPFRTVNYPCNVQALGVRVTAIGFYIKNLSEARRREYTAQDVLNNRATGMQQAALEALAERKESLDKQQAEKLAALQQQHAEELQALQALVSERKTRAQGELSSDEVSQFLTQSLS